VDEGPLVERGQELERSHVVRQAGELRLSQPEEVERLGVGTRQFKRLVRGWKQDGAASLVSHQRGVASYNRLADEERTRIKGLLTETWEDCGPTLVG